MSLNGLSQQSNYNLIGYSNFTNVIFEVYLFESNVLHLKSAGRYHTNDIIKIWIDFNGNAEFEADELVVAHKASEIQTKIEFSVPDDLEVDFLTKMRVFLGDKETDLSDGFISFGEVEDYTIMLSSSRN